MDPGAQDLLVFDNLAAMDRELALNTMFYFTGKRFLAWNYSLINIYLWLVALNYQILRLF